MDGYSVDEAAAVLGVPKGRVWELLARGVLAGTPEDGGGMRVYLQGKPIAPIVTSGERRQEETGSGRENGNGNGGEHGQPGFEASPFRELLTEFRNLTERYGQALLALGEARGEVASLRGRVELLEARVELRLTSAPPHVQWSPPQPSELQPRATLEETDLPFAEQSPAEVPEPSTSAENAQEASISEAMPVPGGPDPMPISGSEHLSEVLPEEASPGAASPDAEGASPDAEEPAPPPQPAQPKARPRRRRQARSAMAGFAEALARAQDPTASELPGADEVGAAFAALQVGIDPDAALAIESAEPSSTEETDSLASAEAFAPSEPVELDALLADEALGGTIPQVAEAAHDAPSSVEDEVDVQPTAGEPDHEIPKEAQAQPAYSSEWDEPDWIAEEDLEGSPDGQNSAVMAETRREPAASELPAADTLRRDEGAPFDESPEIGWDELPAGSDAHGLEASSVASPDVESRDLDNPRIDQLDVESPDAVSPDVEQSSVDQPDVESPEVEQPSAESPDVESLFLEQPSIHQPDVESPDVEASSVESRDLEQPSIDQPDVESPDVEESSVEPPGAESPDTESLDLDKPSSDQPDVESREVVSPDLEQPSIDQPEVESPDVEKPAEALVIQPDVESPQPDESSEVSVPEHHAPAQEDELSAQRPLSDQPPDAWPAEAAGQSQVGQAAAPPWRGAEEELMWLGDEFRSSPSAFRATGRLTSLTRPGAQPASFVSPAEDEALARLAVERGWDDAELHAIRSLLAEPGRELLQEPADEREATDMPMAQQAPAEPIAGNSEAPERIREQPVAADLSGLAMEADEEAFDWEQGPAAWNPPADAGESVELPGGLELEEAMAAFEVGAGSSSTAGQDRAPSSEGSPESRDVGVTDSERPPPNWSKESAEHVVATPEDLPPAEPAQAAAEWTAATRSVLREQPEEPANADWLRGRRGPAANAYRRLRRLFPG